MTDQLDNLEFQLLARGIQVRFESARARRLLLENYGHLHDWGVSPDIEYLIGEEPDSTFFIERSGRRVGGWIERKLIPAFDYDLARHLQLLRPDLLFIHAAVVELEGQAVLLAAPAGTGKSTLAWVLQLEGSGYLTDELAPIDPIRSDVYPFPRAICLKTDPPPPYRLPGDVLRTSKTIHVPARSLRATPGTEPLPIGALVFLHRDGPAAPASIRRLSVGEGATWLYSNALNPRAHAAAGLDIAIDLASRHPCFELTMTDLPSTLEALREALSRELGAAAISGPSRAASDSSRDRSPDSP